MSSIATFYIMPETQCESFAVTQNTDSAASSRDFDYYSGFVIVDYFFTFLQLPEALQRQLAAGTSSDGHYFEFGHTLADSLAAHLEAHPPDKTELAEFAAEQGQDAAEYVPLLVETHSTLIRWFRHVSATEFGVLQITF